MIFLNEQNFLQETKQGLVLLDFFANWCIPCRIMEKNLKHLEERIVDQKIRFYKIDIDKEKTLADSWKIIHLPSIVVLKDGIEIGRFEGCKSGGETGRTVMEWLVLSRFDSD